MRKQIVFILFFVFSGVLFADTLAIVGNTTISDTDVKEFMNDLKKFGYPTSGITESYALNKLIDFNVGLMDAKRQMLDQDVDAIDAMNNALYTYYLEKNVDSKYKNKVFSNKDITAYYQKNPLVKIQRLTYTFNNQVPGDIDKARAQINTLRAELRSKKITFEAALEKAHDKAIPILTGTFDKLLINDLAPQEAIEVKPLQPMEISAVIQGTKFFALTRIVKIYPYSPEYNDDINERMKREAIIIAREKFSKALRQKYASMIQIN